MTGRLEQEFLESMWQVRASELWKADAGEILHRLDNNDAVFVNAPNGSGKSSFLTIQIGALAKVRLWSTWFVDISAAPVTDESDSRKTEWYRQTIFKDAKIAEGILNGVMVLDEVGSVDRYDLLRAVRLSEKAHFNKFVLLIAGTTEYIRQEQIAKIAGGLRQIGKSAVIYEMSPRTLPQELVRELLGIKGQGQEVTDFIIATFPTYPSLIDYLSKYSSREEIMDWWRGSSETLLRAHRGIYSREEFDVIEDKLLNAVHVDQNSQTPLPEARSK